VRALGVAARVLAPLTRRAGRWSLRGGRSKARQAHGDIDLLFDEAAMVNEPFLDLMTSLVATSAVATSEVATSEVAGTHGSAGLVLERGPVKKPARALQKLVRVYGRDVAMLTDLVAPPRQARRTSNKSQCFPEFVNFWR